MANITLFERERGVIFHLVVLDKASHIGYRQLLAALDEGRHFDTEINRRRIYPIESFSIWTPDWRVELALPSNEMVA